MSKTYEKMPGDEDESLRPVEGAEEYLVGRGIDPFFGIVRVADIEVVIDFTGSKRRSGSPFAKFAHRCEAEEYARFLHSGKTLKHEVSDESMRKELVEDVKRLLNDAITESICVGFEYGKSKANADLLEHLGLQECAKALPPCNDCDKAGKALGVKYGNLFGESLLRFFGSDNVRDGKEKEE